MRNRINSHIADIVSWTKGKVVEWDVLNEPITSRHVQALLGDQEMAVWFEKAREADPSVKLFINDFNITENGGYDLARQNAFFQVTKSIVDAGAPLDGIGLQSHFSTTLTPPARVLEVLDRFAQLGKELTITEFDTNVGDEQLQADYLRDYLTATFSHPAVKGFYIWGFWEGRHWRPQAAMLGATGARSPPTASGSNSYSVTGGRMSRAQQTRTEYSGRAAFSATMRWMWRAAARCRLPWLEDSRTTCLPVSRQRGASQRRAF